MAGGIFPPPEVIATWRPNYVNPDSRGDRVAVMEMILLISCYVVVALRVYTRQFLSKMFGWDDALIIFNLLPLTGLAVSLYLGVTRYGWDKHVWDIQPSLLHATTKIGLTIQLTYLLSTNVTKLSVLLFYRRLTERVSTAFLWAVYISIGFVAGASLAGVVTLFVGCRPFNAYWQQVNPVWLADHGGKFWCYDEGLYITIMAVVSMLTDFLVCILPLLLFVRLKMSVRKKLALAVIFGIGFFLCVCGLLRVVVIIRTFYGSYDFTWSTEPAWVWTGIEAHFAVIIACAPATNYFFRRSSNKDSKLSEIASRLQAFSKTYFEGVSGKFFRSHDSKDHRSHSLSTLVSSQMRHKGSIHVKHDIHVEALPTSTTKHQAEHSRAWFDDTNFGRGL